ncbi:MAG TPA: lytic transglycosylase domain-containing protein [Caulobacteraceae bacterium]|jgi:hypothetical protein
MRGLFGQYVGAGALALLVSLVAGGADAQLEVHVDGSVVMYDGASQRMSPGAQPGARIVGGRIVHRRHGASGDAAPAPPPEIATAIHDSAERHQVDENLVRAVAWQESRYHQAAVSAKGARGTMQLEPSTARALGVDADDQAGNIEGGVIYLSKMMHRYDGDTSRALAAYNAGPGAVDRHGGVPPYRETQNYVRQVMAHIGPAGPAEAAADIPLRARMAVSVEEPEIR